MQVHVDRGGERYGPYSIEDVNAHLANGTLLPTDQAWQDGMPNWVPITQIPGVTTPGGAAALPPSPAPADGSACPHCQAPLEAGQVICWGCGAQLRPKGTYDEGDMLIGLAAFGAKAAEEEIAAGKGSSKKSLFISIAVVAVIGLAVALYFLFFNK
jgi:hypothetical protein